MGLAPAAAAEDDIQLIAARTAPVASLSREEAAGLFLGLGTANPGLEPFDQRDPALRERFYQAVAGLSLASVRAHWARQVFTGRGRPPAMIDADAVERVLAETPNAVLYVPARQRPANCKSLLLLKGEPP